MRPSYRWPIVNVGEVTGCFTPSARHAPRISVVLPAPSSPLTSTTSPGRSSGATRAPTSSVSAALEVRINDVLTEQVELVVARLRRGGHGLGGQLGRRGSAAGTLGTRPRD